MPAYLSKEVGIFEISTVLGIMFIKIANTISCVPIDAPLEILHYRLATV